MDRALKRRHAGLLRAPVATHRTFALLATAMLFAGATAFAQVPVDENGTPLSTDIAPLAGADVENPVVAPSAVLGADELDDLVGPIALYPDDLLAVVLPASTYPLEIVQAARFLDRYEIDSTLTPDEDWDDSVVALLNYPEVLRMLNEDLDWTWRLGDAVVRQQADLILAIESFRDRAYAAGNLKSDEYQTVILDDDGIIEIDPVSEDEIYVPYYEPERVVYRSPTPVYHYYPRAYPVYFYPYPRSHYFGSGFFWGVTTAFSIGWATDHLHVYHQSYRGHPFYGHRYHFTGSYWRRPSINVYNTWYVDARHPGYTHRFNRGDYWRPRYRSGSRPIYRPLDRTRSRTVQSGYSRDASRDRDRDYDRNSRAGSSREYRDQRTDGRRFNAGASLNQTEGNNSVRRSGNRDQIRFRPRNHGSVTADRSARLTNNPTRTTATRRNDATVRNSNTRTSSGIAGRSVRTSTNRQSSRAANRERSTSIQTRSRDTNAAQNSRRSSTAPQSVRRSLAQPRTASRSTSSSARTSVARRSEPVRRASPSTRRTTSSASS
ncbi:MAG: DUF3300 domain-containing protein, partial [Pseudomonadota bacterium]